MTAPTSIAVVIRTRTDSAEVFDLLGALTRQTIRPAEIAVIDSGSSPEVLARLRDFASAGIPLRLIQIAPAEYQSARTLNRAISETRSSHVAIISQDALPLGVHYLERLAAAFDDENVAGSYGRQLPDARTDPLGEKDLLRTYPPESRTQRAPDCWFVNTCSMVRRDLWERHAFEERAVISEDHEWAKWAQGEGFVIQYCAEATVSHYHHHGQSTARLWRRHSLEGQGLCVIHGRPPGIFTTLRAWAREVASDALWLVRRGQPHWLPVSVWRRAVKHAALHHGHHAAAREWRSEGKRRLA
jgi:GT2 family glycosyltransferase